jgi:hypothetical protein
MRTTLESQFGNRGNNNQNRGNNNQANMITEMFNIVGKNNAELLTSLKSSLTPDQAALITKAEKDKKVCTVVLDLLNPQQQQQNRGNEGNRGGRGGGGGGFNVPPGFEDLIGFDGGGGGGGGGRGGGGRGGNNQNNNFLREAPDRAFCTSTASTTAERVAPISQLLTKGKKPLTADQEKSFSASIEAKYAKMQEELKASNPEMQRLLNSINDSNRNRGNNNNNNTQQTLNPQTLRNNIVNTIMTNLGIQTNNNNNNNRGGRGGNENFNPNNQNQNNPNANNANANNPNANNPNAQNAQNANNNNNFNRGNRGGNNNIQQELQRKNEELLDHIAAKLNPDQSTIVKKYKYDQIKAKGGVEKYRAILEQEGTPLTAEQTNQIRNLFNAQNQAVRAFAEKQVTDEMAKHASLEPPAPANPNPNQQRPNPNNVNQNPIAQQIVSTLMPLVSRQHALLERTTGDTILKLLTPSQVASYKINSL